MRFMISVLVLAVCVASAWADDEVGGKISAVDPASGTITLSGLTIVAKDATIKNRLDMKITLEKLQPGDGIEADGAFTADKVFTAKEIEKAIFLKEEITAKVSGVDQSARTLSISGVTVRVPDGAEIEDDEGNAAALASITAGQRVEVEGKWSGDGEMTASTIEIKAQGKDKDDDEDDDDKD